MTTPPSPLIASIKLSLLGLYNEKLVEKFASSVMLLLPIRIKWQLHNRRCAKQYSIPSLHSAFYRCPTVKSSTNPFCVPFSIPFSSLILLLVTLHSNTARDLCSIPCAYEEHINLVLQLIRLLPPYVPMTYSCCASDIGVCSLPKLHIHKEATTNNLIYIKITYYCNDNLP